MKFHPPKPSAEGYGWLAVGDKRRAADSFDQAAGRSWSWGDAILAGRRAALDLPDDIDAPTPKREGPSAEPMHSIKPVNSEVAAGSIVSGELRTRTRGKRYFAYWEDIVEEGAQLERERAFPEAIALYVSAQPEAGSQAAFEQLEALARCHLERGDSTSALHHARRALAIDGTRSRLVMIVIRAAVHTRDLDGALLIVDGWLARDSENGEAHYLRGRVLLQLRRYVDAREAFDRALAANPTMIEAMLLRREVDRWQRSAARSASSRRSRSISRHTSPP